MPQWRSHNTESVLGIYPWFRGLVPSTGWFAASLLCCAGKVVRG
jgi:hypothetical protein